MMYYPTRPIKEWRRAVCQAWHSSFNAHHDDAYVNRVDELQKMAPRERLPELSAYVAPPAVTDLWCY